MDIINVFKDMAKFNSRIKIPIKAILIMDSWMDKDNLHGLVDWNIKDPSSIMLSQVMEIINGLMEAGIKDNYSMEKDMVKANIIALKINLNIMANGNKA